MSRYSCLQKYFMREFLSGPRESQLAPLKFFRVIQNCFICRPSDSTVSEDAGIEPRTFATTLALTPHAVTTRLDLIYSIFFFCRKFSSRLFADVNDTSDHFDSWTTLIFAIEGWSPSLSVFFAVAGGWYAASFVRRQRHRWVDLRISSRIFFKELS
jgi:hypothetical protein